MAQIWNSGWKHEKLLFGEGWCRSIVRNRQGIATWGAYGKGRQRQVAARCMELTIGLLTAQSRPGSGSPMPQAVTRAEHCSLPCFHWGPLVTRRWSISKSAVACNFPVVNVTCLPAFETFPFLLWLDYRLTVDSSSRWEITYSSKCQRSPSLASLGNGLQLNGTGLVAYKEN